MNWYPGEFMRSIDPYKLFLPCEKCYKISIDKCSDCTRPGEIEKYKRETTAPETTDEHIKEVHLNKQLYDIPEFSYYDTYMMIKSRFPEQTRRILRHYLFYYNPAADTRRYLIKSNEKYKYIGYLKQIFNNFVLKNEVDNHQYYRRCDIWHCTNCNLYFIFDNMDMSIQTDFHHEYIRKQHDKKCDKIKRGEITFG